MTMTVDCRATSIVTINQMGRTSLVLNEIDKLFVEYATCAPLPVLDIGCAYGIAALAALEAGARVIANDICADHLFDVVARTHDAHRDRLRIIQGHFPQELYVRPGSLSAIHAANLLNFLTGED